MNRVILAIGEWCGVHGMAVDPFPNAVMAACKEIRFSQGVVSARGRQDRRQPGGLVGRQVARGFLKVVTGGGFSAIDAFPPFGYVEIELENAFLRQVSFERARNQRFPRFSYEGSFG